MFIAVLMLGCCFAQSREAPKPRCNGETRGQLWPRHDIHDPYHPVEICTQNVWKYRWEPVTVSITQLAKDPKRRTACSTADHGSASVSGPAQSVEAAEAR